MKGIVLAGGFGNRLKPLTEVTNKHLLPVYDKPLIFHPLKTLLDAGLSEILIVTGPEHLDQFKRLLGSGEKMGCHIAYAVQETPGGIAEALGLAKEFVGVDSMAVILGDNIYEGNFKEAVDSFDGGATIFLKEVHDPDRFGVPELEGDRVLNIEEKPQNPKSPYAVTGLYLYDSSVFEIIQGLKPSDRGELEITDVNNHYLQKSQLRAVFVDGNWTDAGTFESLYEASTLARKIALNQS